MTAPLCLITGVGPGTGSALLPYIQTAADFFESGNVDNGLNERERIPMMNRIHTANPGRAHSDSPIGLFGEKEGMLWEDPLLKPRKDIVYR